MKKIFLIAATLILSTAVSFAQTVPQSPQQINLSFAPVVEQVAHPSSIFSQNAW